MMNLTYQTPPAKPTIEPEKMRESKSKGKLWVIGCIAASAILAILLFFVFKVRGNYVATIYLNDPTFGLLFNILLVLTVLFASLGWIAEVEFAKKVLIVLAVCWFGFIIAYVFRQTAIGKEIGSSMNFFFSSSFDYIGRAFCYLKPENVATGNFEECEAEDAEKEGRYENLEVVFGIKDSGKVDDTNVQPVSGKPYKLDITLTNLNQKRRTVFQGSIYDITVKRIEGYASAYSFASVDFSDHSISTDAEYTKEFTIEPGYSEWIRLEFDELPCCLGRMYFHTRVTSEQTGSGKSTIGIVPYSMESDKDEYRNFVRTFEKSASMSPGPVNVYVLSSPAIISQPDLGSDTFSIILKIKNRLSGGSAKLLTAKIIPPFDYIDITQCSSSDDDDLDFSTCSDASNCVEMALEDEPLIKSLQTFEIECQASISKSKYNEYDKRGFISAEVTYEYTIENDYQKSARCDCSPSTSSGSGSGSSTTKSLSKCDDLTEKCPTRQKLIDKIVCEARAAGVPADIMLGIARTESGLNHCNTIGDVITGDGGISIGLMQVSQCSGVGDVHDVNNNIICSIKHLQEKCTYSRTSSLNNGIGVCNPTGLCTDSSVRCTYCSNVAGVSPKVYKGWDIAVRGYNGWGKCDVTANYNYVETVKQYAAQYRRYV